MERIPLVLVLLLGLAGCGTEGGPPRAPGLGTLSIANETDQSGGPLTIEQLFVQPVGIPETPINLLNQPIGPGGIVIVGQFAEGQYDVLALLEGNLSWVQNGVVIVSGQPTTLRLRFD